MNMITIRKKPGIKNCIRITSPDDIPEFLREVVSIDGEYLVLDCLEGEQRVPIGSVIAFEKLDEQKMKEYNREHEMNVWEKSNWATTTVEKDGVFYEIPQSVVAVLLNEDMPSELVEQLGDVLKCVNGEYQLLTKQGISKAAANTGYLVIHGVDKNGKLNANILTIGTPSFNEYYVVDPDGELGESLSSYHDKHCKKR